MNNLSASDRKTKTQKNYSAIAPLYTQDFERDWENFELIKEAIDLIEPYRKPIHKIVDLGSGPGNVVDYLLGEGIENIEAVDITDEFINYLSEKYHNRPEISVVHADMVVHVAGLTNESIALFTAGYSIIHIPDEELDRLFQNMYRSLIPHGIAVMSLYKGTEKKMETNPYFIKQDKRLTSHDPIESYMNYLTEKELRERLLHAGFSIHKLIICPNSQTPGDFSADIMWVIAIKP
jgi:SAM-dependent methyltransferase